MKTPGEKPRGPRIDMATDKVKSKGRSINGWLSLVISLAVGCGGLVVVHGVADVASAVVA